MNINDLDKNKIKLISQPPITNVNQIKRKQEEQPKEKSRLEKIADFGLSMIGAKTFSKLAKPIISSYAINNPFVSKKTKEKILLGKPDELTGKMETEGFKSVAKDIAGSSLELGTKAAMFTNPLASAGGRIAFGTALGAASGASKPLQEDASGKDVLMNTGVGALIGLTLSGVFEGVSKLGQSRLIKNKIAGTYQKELNANKIDDIAAIEYAKPGEPYKILGAKILNEVDDKGKPLYVGNYDTIRDKAHATIVNNSNKLKPLVASYDKKVVVSRSEVAGDIVKQIQNKVGRLKPSELKIIKFEVSKLPFKMNASDLLKYKQEIYKRIPERVFDVGLDRSTSIANSAKYILAQNLRKILNEKTADPMIQQLNDKISLAMDVRLLAAYQIQSRLGDKLASAGAGGTRTKLIAKIIDDLFFPTWLTTKVAQSANKVGTNLSIARPASFLKTGVISNLSKIPNLFNKE